MSVKKKKKSRCSDGAEDSDPLILPMDPLRLVDSNSKTSIIVIDNDKKKKKERKKKKRVRIMPRKLCRAVFRDELIIH